MYRNGSSSGNNKNHKKNKTLKHNKISTRVKIVVLVFDIGKDISSMHIFKPEFHHNSTLGLVYIHILMYQICKCLQFKRIEIFLIVKISPFWVSTIIDGICWKPLQYKTVCKIAKTMLFSFGSSSHQFIMDHGLFYV